MSNVVHWRQGDETLPLVALADATLHLPVRVTEFTDFYASKNHAFNVGALFRGPENALPPQWTHMPIGYNGRASSVVVSGTDIHRPMGQVKGESGPEWTACRRLDLELELGAVVGMDSTMGERVSVTEAERMIFGYVLLNDWSARDIQAWEYQPLGPFLSKSFATMLSPWIVTTTVSGGCWAVENVAQRCSSRNANARGSGRNTRCVPGPADDSRKGMVASLSRNL